MIQIGFHNNPKVEGTKHIFVYDAVMRLTPNNQETAFDNNAVIQDGSKDWDCIPVAALKFHDMLYVGWALQYFDSYGERQRLIVAPIGDFTGGKLIPTSIYYKDDCKIITGNEEDWEWEDYTSEFDPDAKADPRFPEDKDREEDDHYEHRLEMEPGRFIAQGNVYDFIERSGFAMIREDSIRLAGEPSEDLVTLLLKDYMKHELVESMRQFAEEEYFSCSIDAAIINMQSDLLVEQEGADIDAFNEALFEAVQKKIEEVVKTF